MANLPPPPPVAWLETLAGYLILVFMAGVGLRLLYKMYQNEIDLAKLLCEPKGTDDCAASMSRFQLLIFTFVITLSLFLIIVGNTPLEFPKIPSEILMLLGISASTYAVGKGIAASNGGGGAVTGAAKSAHDAASQAHGHADAAQASAAGAKGNADVAQDSAGKAQSAAATAQSLLTAAQQATADAQQAAKDAAAAAARANPPRG